MEKIKIMVDTPSDIEITDADSLNIKLMPVSISYKGKTYKETYEMSKDNFYKILNECEELPTTAQITPNEFLDAYEELANEGYTHIINVTINAAGSGTNNSANLAVKLFNEKHGESKVKFEVIDSHTYTFCYGRPVMNAAKMIIEKKSFDEVVKYIKDTLSHFHGYAYMSTLKFAKLSGRISVISAIVGETLGLKPIISVGNSKVETINKCRGEKAAINKLIDNVKKDAVDIEKNEIILVYGDIKADVVDRLENEVKEKLNPKSICRCKLGCSITNNAGPQTMGLLFLGENYNLY